MNKCKLSCCNRKHAFINRKTLKFLLSLLSLSKINYFPGKAPGPFSVVNKHTTIKKLQQQYSFSVNK